MFITSRNPFLKRGISNDLLAAFSARPAAALLITPFVHLYTARTNAPSQDSVVADFTEAAFTGYAAVALALPLLGPINADTDHSGVHNEVDFVAGAVTPPGQSIMGYWIDEAASGGASLYAAEEFETPIPIAALGDYISLDVILALPWQEQISP